MPWIYLIAALVVPPVLILWRPQRRLSPRASRVRLALSIIIVWMLTILWTVRGSLGGNAPSEGLVQERNYSERRERTEPEEMPDGNASESTQSNRVKTSKSASRPVRPALPKAKQLDPSAPMTQPSSAMQHGSDGDKDISWDWSLDAPPDTGLMLMLGWIPGLFYAGLLFLGRKALERPQAQVIEGYGDPRRGGPFMSS